MPLDGTVVPYCGLPPQPETLAERWNFDPVLLATLLTVALAYGFGHARLRARPGAGREAVLFGAGWLVLAAALVSPLCALTVSLFSARVGQHMLVAMVAAPLLALGRPGPRLEALLPAIPGAMVMRRVGGQAASAILFGAALWLWHTPAAYSLTFRSDAAYWVMHVTLAGSAILLWHALAVRGPAEPLAAFASGFATTLHMSLLGALLTFASRPLFAPHAATATPWGLTALEDQQLGGLIMWIPGGTVLIVASLVLIGLFIRAGGRPTPAPA